MDMEYTYWKDGEWYVGFFNDYPLHGTQGKSLEELEAMLTDLYENIKDDLPRVTGDKKTSVLTVPV
jgi:predicted RNase H-like HicB family nuclease